MSSIKKSGIFTRMAKLCEQKRLVNAAYNMCGYDKDYKPTTVLDAANKMLGVMSEAEIVNSALNVKIFSDEGDNFAKTINESGYWHRRNKIGTLFKNSVNDGFFVKDFSKERAEKIVDYYCITGNGTDLLHWLGFLKIATLKYSKTVVFIWGIFFTVMTQLLLWVANNWGTMHLWTKGSIS